jgi:hypothetical protein
MRRGPAARGSTCNSGRSAAGWVLTVKPSEEPASDAPGLLGTVATVSSCSVDMATLLVAITMLLNSTCSTHRQKVGSD